MPTARKRPNSRSCRTGWRRPVRFGKSGTISTITEALTRGWCGVAGQLQLNNQGHFLQSLYFWSLAGGRIGDAEAKMAQHAIQTLRERWSEPDSGMWESHEKKQFTYSKIATWTALRLGQQLGLLDAADAACSDITTEVLENGLRRRRDGSTYLAAHYHTDDVS